MRKLLFLYAVCLLLVFPVVANATPISADLTGTRSTAVGGGLTATDGWSGTGNNGFGIRWIITYDGISSLYRYEYTISGEGGADLSKGLSHWILEVTDGSKKKDFENVEPGFSNNSPKQWNHNNPSYPNMLSGIYGIKWETTGDDVLTYTVSFDTEKDPVWGDFYANDGIVAAEAWNLGFGETPTETSNFMRWIARPGDDPPTSHAPEPATMLLLGSGLIGIAVSGKKRLKKRNG